MFVALQDYGGSEDLSPKMARFTSNNYKMFYNRHSIALNIFDLDRSKVKFKDGKIAKMLKSFRP